MKHETTFAILLTLATILLKQDITNGKEWDPIEPSDFAHHDSLKEAIPELDAYLAVQTDGVGMVQADLSATGTIAVFRDNVRKINYMFDLYQTEFDGVVLRSVAVLQDLPCEIENMKLLECKRTGRSVDFHMADQFSCWHISQRLEEACQAMLDTAVFDHKANAMLGFLHSALKTL